jgi:signal transduction histidine kinase
VAQSPERASAPPRSVDEIWLGVLQQISARSAHEIKGALNGVSVNLAVVRSRSSKAEASAASVATFAASAADQLELVVGMTEALLALSRAPREPLDVGDTVARFAALLAPSARAEGVSLRVEQPARDGTNKTVRAPGSVVRALIGAALLAALAKKGDIRCRVDAGGDEAVVSIECADAELGAGKGEGGGEGGALDMPSDVVVAAADAGVRVRAEGQTLSLAFPRALARQRKHERA